MHFSTIAITAQDVIYWQMLDNGATEEVARSFAKHKYPTIAARGPENRIIAKAYHTLSSHNMIYCVDDEIDNFTSIFKTPIFDNDVSNVEIG